MKEPDDNEQNQNSDVESLEEDEFADVVQKKEARRKKRQEEEKTNIWFGMGMFGLVGWSVAIPTVLFLGLGIMIDRYLPGSYSWTLTGLIIGIVVGCVNAWKWISVESQEK